jgi:hypothetical protein
VNTSIRYRASRLAANTTTNCESPFSTSPSHLSATTTSATHGNILITLGKPSCLVSRSTLLQNTFVVLAGRTFFVSATVADTIHTIRKIVVYWYRLSNRHLKSIFKNKKMDLDRSLTRCRPQRPGRAGREEPLSPCARRRSRH